MGSVAGMDLGAFLEIVAAATVAVALTQRVKLDLDQSPEGQRGDRKGLATRLDLRDGEHGLPLGVDHAVARHVAGQENGRRVDVLERQIAGRQSGEHLAEDDLQLLVEITDHLAVLDLADRTGEVEALADLHTERKGLARGFELDDALRLFLLGHTVSLTRVLGDLRCDIHDVLTRRDGAIEALMIGIDKLDNTIVISTHVGVVLELASAKGREKGHAASVSREGLIKQVEVQGQSQPEDQDGGVVLAHELVKQQPLTATKFVVVDLAGAELLDQGQVLRMELDHAEVEPPVDVELGVSPHLVSRRAVR